MAIKGGYKKDKSLNWGEYKSSPMIASEFKGREGEREFDQMWDETFDDAAMGINMLTSGFNTMSIMDNLMWGMASDEAREAVEANVGKDTSIIENAVNAWATEDAAKEKVSFESSVNDMVGIQLEGIPIHKMVVGEDGSYLKPGSYQLPEQYRYMGEEQLRYVQTGIANRLKEDLLRQGYSEEDIASGKYDKYYDTAHFTGTDRVGFSKSEIKEQRGRLGGRKKDSFEGRTLVVDDIEPDAEVFKEYGGDAKDRWRIRGDRLKDIGEEATDVVKQGLTGVVGAIGRLRSGKSAFGEFKDNKTKVSQDQVGNYNDTEFNFSGQTMFGDHTARDVYDGLIASGMKPQDAKNQVREMYNEYYPESE